jgi:autotransporter-associated beta strand protein
MGLRIGNSAAIIDAQNAIVIGSAISSATSGYGFTLTGVSTLTLSGANTLNGDITISAGTLKLDAGGTIPSVPNIIIASGAAIDVSTKTTAFAMGASQTLKATATGGNTTATITTASGKGLTLSAGGLVFTQFGGGATAPLTVAGAAANTFVMNSAPVTVTTTTPLVAGTYKLVAKSGSATVTGTPGTLTINGSGVPAGATASIAVTSGELILTVTATAPTVTSSAATSIGTTTATLNGNVTSDGGATISERGFVYDTSSGVVITDNMTPVAGTTGSYDLGLSSLGVNVEYYFKAYAINSVNTTLSSELSFWTLANTPSAPTVGGATTGSLDVTVNVNGNPSGTAFAIHETSLDKYVQADGSLNTTEVFQSESTWGTKTVTGLNPNTAYTFEVKARNGANVETGFGATASDTTLALGCTPPTIDSTTPVNLTCNGSADGSITVSASGGITPYEYSKDNGANWQSGNAFTGLAAGNYQIKVRGADECTSPSTPVTLTQPDAVTITLGSSPTVCFGTTSANLPYSATTGTPTLYSIDFDATAEGEGFVDVTDAALPVSPIVITVPGAAVAGTYNATLTVKTATCTSSGYAIAVTVNAASVGGSIAPATTAFCGSGSTTLTLSGHTGTVTKWQYSTVSDFSSGVTEVANTTTTLTTPTLTATRYYRAVVTSGVCSSSDSAIATLTVNPLPTITLGANPTVCSDAGSANKPYTATTGSPDQYSIDFNAAANTAGFTDVVLASLPASPIVITVPNGVAAGTYTGTLTVKNSTTGCESSGTTISVTVNAFTLPGTIFSENMGPGQTGVNIAIATYSNTNGWQNGSPVTFTSTAANAPDVRVTTASSGYTGVSGGANVYFAAATGTRNLVISGVNTLGYSSIQLQFGLKADTIVGGDPFVVEVSSDGTSYTPLTFTQPTTSWGLITASGTIPATSNLRLRFSKNTTAVFRLDDVKLTGTPPAVASITPSDPTTFCDSGTVTLTANAGGASYLWSPGGATTAAVTVNPSSTTTYTVLVTGANGCSSSASQTVTVNEPATVNAGPDQMIPAGNTVTLAGTIGGGATSGTWSGGTGSFSPNATALDAVYTPSGAEVAARTVTLTLTTDAPGVCSAVNDSVTITINTAPVALNVTSNCTPGLSLVIQITGAGGIATDADGDTLNVTTAGFSSEGTNMVFTAGSDKYIYYQNTNAAAASDSFTYTVTDGFGGSDTKTINLTISGPNSESLNLLSGPDVIGAGPDVQLKFLTIPGYAYALELTHNLTPTITWTPVVTNAADATGLITYTNTPTAGPDYYRTRWVP